MCGMIFTVAERRYLESQQLCRFATIGPGGVPHVRPLGFRLNPDGTIDIGGPNHRATQRFRNAVVRPDIGLVVDDMTPDEPGAVKPGMGRGVEVRGHAEAVVVDEPPVNPSWFSHDVLRVYPRRVLSWHIDPAMPDGEARDIDEFVR